MMSVSLIIPVLNEATIIQQRLQQLNAQIKHHNIAVEIIVVDGGSQDKTSTLAMPYANKVINSASGRAVQMNAGAKVATGEWLLFLHLDTILPQQPFHFLSLPCLSAPAQWGFYAVKLTGEHYFFRIIERMISLRSRLTHVATGDQCLFIKRKLFHALGGFASIPLMEDVEMSKRLRKVEKPLFISTPVITSSRRWETHGILRTVILMWLLRLLYFCGVHPRTLAKAYYG